MKIILIGFMGSGKSSVAKALKKKLNIPVIEMDDLIVKKSGKQTINEIFSNYGEEFFRDLETEVARDISKIDNVIVSTGGGVVMKERNYKFLKNGKIFFLRTSFNTLKKRLTNDNTRPLFKDLRKAKKLFNLRQPLYEKWADKIIKTDNKSIDQIITRLLKLL